MVSRQEHARITRELLAAKAQVQLLEQSLSKLQIRL